MSRSKVKITRDKNALSAVDTPRRVRMVCARCKQRAATADGPTSWLPRGVVQLCRLPVLRRWENQRMLSSLKLKTAHAVLRVSLLKIQLIHYIIRNLTSYQHDLITQTKTANNISSKNFIKGKPLKIDITFQKQQVMKNQSQRVHMRLHQQLCIWFKRPSLITYREVQNGLHLRSFNFLSCYNENKIKLSK